MSYQDQVDRSYLSNNGWRETKGGWLPVVKSGLVIPISTKRALAIMKAVNEGAVLAEKEKVEHE